MNCGDNIQTLYFSAVLAKAFQEHDGDKFTVLYDLICTKAASDEVTGIKETARTLSELTVHSLSEKIAALQKQGAKPLPFFKDKRDPPKVCTSGNKDNLEKRDLNENLSLGIGDSNQTDERLLYNSLSNDELYGKRSLAELQNNLVKACNGQSKSSSFDESSQLKSSDVGSASLVEKRITAKNKDLFKIQSSTATSFSKKQSSSVKNDTTDLPKNNADDISKGINFSFLPNGIDTKQAKAQPNKVARTNNKLFSNASPALSTKTTIPFKETVIDDIKQTKKEKKQQVETTDVKLPQNQQKPEESSKARSSEQDIQKKSKPRKRTIKEYQREKLNSQAYGQKEESNIISNSVSGNSRKLHPTKCEQRKQQERLKMEMLPDEEVKKIVAECGDNPDSVKESKKKFSEKSDAVKKDKRRAKKLKKQSKKKTVEPEKGDAGTCPDYRNNDHATADTMKTSSVDTRSNEPSAEGKTDIVLSSVPVGGKETNGVFQDEMFHSNNSKPWPNEMTNPTDFQVPFSKTLTDATNSYSVKFKSNLDSTGCSLGSTSEDSSSTSSSSSNTYNNLPELLSLDTNNNERIMRDISNVLLKTAAGANENLSELPIEPLSKADGNAEIDDDKPNKSSPVNQSPTKDLIAVSGSNRTDKYSTEIESKINTMSSSAAYKSSECENSTLHTTESNEAYKSHTSEDALKLALKNKWGLDFFIDDEPPSITPDPLSSSKDYLVSFGDEPLNSEACQEALNFEVKLQDAAVSFCSIRITNMPRKYHPGDFNLKEATDLLLKEWKSAFRRGRYYEEV